MYSYSKREQLTLERREHLRDFERLQELHDKNFGALVEVESEVEVIGRFKVSHDPGII